MYKRQTVLLAGVALFLVQWVTTFYELAVLFTILGTTAVVAYVPMVEIVSKNLAYKHRGKALALISSGTAYGVFANSWIVPHYLNDDHWRGAWDFVGKSTIALSILAFLILAFIAKIQKPNKTIETVAPEKKAKLGVLRNSKAIYILLIMFFGGVICMSFQSFLSPYLRQELNFSVWDTSQTWMTIAIVGMFGTFIVGWIADKTGMLNGLMICFVFLLITLTIMVFIPIRLFIPTAAICFSLGFNSMFGLIPAYISQNYSITETTIVFAAGNIALGLGGVTGNCLLYTSPSPRD